MGVVLLEGDGILLVVVDVVNVGLAPMAVAAGVDDRTGGIHMLGH